MTRAEVNFTPNGFGPVGHESDGAFLFNCICANHTWKDLLDGDGVHRNRPRRADDSWRVQTV
jgi:hypothetical protein